MSALERLLKVLAFWVDCLRKVVNLLIRDISLDISTWAGGLLRIPASVGGQLGSGSEFEKAEIPALATRFITCGRHPSMQFSWSNPMSFLSLAAIVVLLDVLSAVMQKTNWLIPNVWRTLVRWDAKLMPVCGPSINFSVKIIIDLSSDLSIQCDHFKDRVVSRWGSTFASQAYFWGDFLEDRLHSGLTIQESSEDEARKFIGRG